MSEPIITDATPISAGHTYGGFGGLIPRDPIMHKVGYSAAIPPASIPLIPRSEWSERIREMEATKSRLSDIRDRGDAGNRIRSLNQNGQGYCWAYATVSAMILLRAKAGLPHVRLSAHAIGCKVKNFRDEGGWGALSLEFAMKYGCPSVGAWPEQSMSRANDRPEAWEDAAKYKPDEGFVDLASPVYDRNLTFDQTMTLLLNRIPVVCDFDFWSHAVCAVDPVETSPGRFGIRIWNSWGDSWGAAGMGVLEGTRAIPSNAVAPTTINA